MSISRTPSKNEIFFVWFTKCAWVTIKTPSKTLVIDPVDVKPRDFKNVDAVLVTHAHYDHLDQPLLAELHKLTQRMVIADPTSAKRLKNVIPQEKLKDDNPRS